MSNETTHIRVSLKNYKRLLDLKEKPSQSFDDLIGMVLDSYFEVPSQDAEELVVE